MIESLRHIPLLVKDVNKTSHLLQSLFNAVEYYNHTCRIKYTNLNIKSGRERGNGEARSFSFYDYDNSIVELHTGMLAERLLRYSPEEQPPERNRTGI